MPSLSSLESRLAAIEGQIPRNLIGLLSAARTRIKSLTDAVDSVIGVVENHSTRLANQNTRIQALETKVASLEARVTALETTVPT